jgi:hypothetical protein
MFINLFQFPVDREWRRFMNAVKAMIKNVERVVKVVKDKKCYFPNFANFVFNSHHS